MDYWVYILQSQSSERYYCGQTDNIGKRLRQHNDPGNTFTKTTTRFKGPWQLVQKIPCPNRTEAIKLERKIKKRGIGRYLADFKKGCC
ncbi:GIY-YIG nuclease family protein [Thermodesulfobacteriota bacterium]